MVVRPYSGVDKANKHTNSTKGGLLIIHNINQYPKEYKTVEKEATIELIEKKSRFIAGVKSVKSENDALDFINNIKSKHGKANHNVYAYLLMKNNIQRHSDDGEPSGTAGVPVLDTIIKEGLTDVCIVVTRYFGGTLLGAGGLVRAYGKSATLVLNKAGIVIMKLCDVLEITCDYTIFGKVKNEIENDSIIIKDIIYKQNVTIVINIEIDKTQWFIKRITDITNARAVIHKVGSGYIPFKGKQK